MGVKQYVMYFEVICHQVAFNTRLILSPTMEKYFKLCWNTSFKQTSTEKQVAAATWKGVLNVTISVSF